MASRTKREALEVREAAMRLQNVFRRVQRARTAEERALLWEQAKQDRMLVGKTPWPARNVSRAEAENAYLNGDASL